MSRKSIQARQRAATQARMGVRTQTIAQTKPSVRTEMAVQAPKGHSHKVEVPKVRGKAFATWLILILVMNPLVICLSGVTLVVYIMQHQPASLYWSVIA